MTDSRGAVVVRIVFLIGIPYIRTLLFVLGWVCVVGLFVELVK